MNGERMKWHWEEIDAGRSGSSGDISKLFKNEAYKAPGVLSVDAPSVDATLLAREAIQNSWDAARGLEKRLREQGEDPPPFRVTFRYEDLVGEAKRDLVEATGLRELRSRATGGSRTKLGLKNSDCLDLLDDLDAPLQILVLDESGTTGMEGAWGANSKLYLAMVSIGFTLKEAGAGGSYGYGKAGLIRASAVRTVLAYTAFEKARGDTADRRLLGMTYWGQHEQGGSSYTGFARLGEVTSDSVVPFENAAADELAVGLGLRLRDPSQSDDLGSSFMLIDPTVEPDQLRRGIERSWWPALEDGLFDVEIRCADGELLHPRPMKDEVLRPFIRGYELATTAQDNDVDEEYRKVLAPYRPSGGPQVKLGAIGLVAEMKGWSYAHSGGGDDEDSAGDQSLVALVRGPRMVVEYYPTGRSQPYVRGTFVADPDVDDLLRQTEPKAHDAWLAKQEEEGIDPLAPKIAAELLKRVRKEVRDFRSRLKPPPPREQDIRLPLLDDLFRGILENRGTNNPPPPHPDPRPVSIRVEQHLEVAGSDQIKLVATARISLNDNYQDGDVADAHFLFRYAFDEDGRLGDDCPLEVKAPRGFAVVEDDDQKGTFAGGQLSREAAVFELQSEPYPSDWTGQLIVSAEPIAVDEPVVASGSKG